MSSDISRQHMLSEKQRDSFFCICPLIGVTRAIHVERLADYLTQLPLRPCTLEARRFPTSTTNDPPFTKQTLLLPSIPSPLSSHCICSQDSNPSTWRNSFEHKSLARPSRLPQGMRGRQAQAGCMLWRSREIKDADFLAGTRISNRLAWAHSAWFGEPNIPARIDG